MPNHFVKSARCPVSLPLSEFILDRASRVVLRIGKCRLVQAWSEIPDLKKKNELRDLDSDRYAANAFVIRTVTKPLLGVCKPLKIMQRRDAAPCLQRPGKLLRMGERGELLFLHFSACRMNFKQPLGVSKAANHWQQKYLNEFSKEWRPSLQFRCCGSSGQNELQVQIAPLAVWYANPTTMTNPPSETFSSSYLSFLFSFLIHNSDF